VQGRVLIFYVFGDEGDLEWGRTVSQAWIEAVLEANPPTATTRIAESLVEGFLATPWGEIRDYMILGIVVILAVLLLVWGWRRSKISA
jgi:hypothetical protein